MTCQASFDAIADQLLDQPGVSEGTGFGSSPGLRINGRIFVMLAPDGLIVKLPARRCAELVAADLARPFDRGQGRPLKEWVVIRNDAEPEGPHTRAKPSTASSPDQRTAGSAVTPLPSRSAFLVATPSPGTLSLP